MGLLDEAMGAARRGVGQGAQWVSNKAAATPVTPAVEASAAEGGLAGRAGRLLGKATRVAAPLVQKAAVASPLLGFNDYKLNEPGVDSSAAGTFKSLGSGDFTGAGRSLVKGAKEAVLDSASGVSKFVDGAAGVVGADTGLARGLAQKVRGHYGDGVQINPSLTDQPPVVAQPAATPVPQPPVAPGTSATPNQPVTTANQSAPEDKFSRLVDQLSNARSTAPAVRAAPNAASSFREPPALDTSMVAGDATGLGTLAKIAAQQPAAAEWAAGMRRAKNQDALQLQAEAAGDLNARAGDQLKMQGLSKAADIYAQQAQRQHERGLARNKLEYDRAEDTEKRYEKRIEDTFGPAFDKDGKANPNRQKFETALNAYLDQAGVDKRQLDPSTFEKILLASQSAAYNPSPGIGSQLLQKALGGSTAATTNAMDATQPTSEQALGGVFVRTADGRYKLASDVHGGGTLTDIFSAPNREVQSRFAKEAAEAAKRRQEN